MIAGPVPGALVGSIPSPSFSSIGPLNVYGLMIAAGVVAAVWLMGRRFEQRGVGTLDDASSIGVGAVVAGVIGSRLYHVATDWDRFSDDLASIPKLWEGGLGIPGGLLAGIPVGLWLARRRGISVASAATCAAPAIPLAQAIGRWGNYFNQELYGRPTDLPWALEIDAEHVVTNPDTGAPFAVGTTFHPTFLYESLWSLGLCLLLLWVDRRRRPGGGSLMALYVAGYGVGRFWVEGLRVDPADEIGGLRWNQWVALAAAVGGLVAYVLLRNRSDAVPDGPDTLDVEMTDGVDDDGTASPAEVSPEPHPDAGASDAGADRVGSGAVPDDQVDRQDPS